MLTHALSVFFGNAAGTISGIVGGTRDFAAAMSEVADQARLQWGPAAFSRQDAEADSTQAA